MSAAFFLLIAGGILYAACTGQLSEVSAAVMKAGQDAVETSLGMTGGFMLFGGLIGILENAGMIRLLTKRLRRPLNWLFGQDVGEDALEAIAVNLSANMLGLSNAATPMGMQAARLLNMNRSQLPSHALCMLLVINSTSVQLLPSSVIALRSAAGSARPDAVILPSLAASAVSTALGIALCKRMEKRERAA